MKLEPWNIKQLHAALMEDLKNCQSSMECSMAKAIGGKEIRKKAIEYSCTRKLTPMEVAIAEQYGYRG